jgi:SAM-dependent methyltransferase
VTELGRGFDSIAELYDAVRPDYPAELYDALDAAVGGLAGRQVLDLAAGTGIATRELVRRGAHPVALEPGEPMLRALRVRSPEVPVVMAAAERIPLRDDSVDVAVCATAWHWFTVADTVAELRRVLRPEGHVGLWWANNRWGEGVDWEEARRAVYLRWETSYGSRPPTYAGVGPKAAARDLEQRGLTVVAEQEFLWTRERTREEHVRALATHSDVIAFGDRKGRFLEEVAAALAPWPTVTERLWGPLVVARF